MLLQYKLDFPLKISICQFLQFMLCVCLHLSYHKTLWYQNISCIPSLSFSGLDFVWLYLETVRSGCAKALDLTFHWGTPVYTTAVCSILSVNAMTGWFYILLVQVNNSLLSSTNHEINNLFIQIKGYHLWTYQLKLGYRGINWPIIRASGTYLMNQQMMNSWLPPVFSSAESPCLTGPNLLNPVSLEATLCPNQHWALN